MSQADVSNVYGALANVAAITTALQAAVSLQSLTQAGDIETRREKTSVRSAERNDVLADANSAKTGAIVLNMPAAIVNAAVLAGWGKVAIGQTTRSQWELYLPWIAVSCSAAFLLICASVAILRLHRLGKE